MARHNDLGKWGEDIAERYLRQRGYILLECDWHRGNCDADLIMLTEDRMTVVFVEVKTRTTVELFSPEDAVTLPKMKKIGWVANEYIKLKDMSEEARFDIVTIVGDGHAEPHIEHIEDAFNPMLI